MNLTISGNQSKRPAETVNLPRLSQELDEVIHHFIPLLTLVHLLQVFYIKLNQSVVKVWCHVFELSDDVL